ncbi:hypothetical protein ACIP6X_10160 [Streptomyces coeruleorubidus]|uniref:hypothetical protein n=1 Tax=Streptomyces coeruleorubidus TaxID=116188 RepID=UPI0037FA9569
MNWQPQSGEETLARFPASFATGTAASVAGRRSFRDRRRNDIETELSGWPEGNAFAVRRLPGRIGVHVRTATSGLFAVVGGILSDLLGGSTIDPESGRGKLEDRENEVDDFPVMWADAGDIARTLPWQLDPSRRPHGYVTEVVLTTRRLLIVGSGEVLWETPAERIASASFKRFSIGRRDFQITFQDGSWARLTTNASPCTVELVGLLSGSHRRLSEAELSPAQRERLSGFASSLPADAARSVITKLPSGLVRVQFTLPGRQKGIISETQSFVMDDAGKDATPVPGDIEPSKA